LLAGSGLYIAGSYEPLVFTCMLSCVIYLGTLIKRHGWRVWVFPFDKKIIVFLSALMAGFYISYSGEGHVVRSAFLPQTSFDYRLITWVKSCIKMFVLYIPAKIPMLALLSVPWMLVGSIALPKIIHKKFVVRLTILFVAFCMVSLAPVSFIMSEMGPERAWTQISLAMVIYASIVSMYFGKWMTGKVDLAQWLLPGIVIMLIVVSFSCISNVYFAKAYSLSYNARMELLQQKENTVADEPVKLEALEEPGWLHSAEISSDTSHFTNLFLQKYLGLKTKPILKAPEKNIN
jgi:hypothetical protein